jgi:hypothetical protein
MNRRSFLKSSGAAGVMAGASPFLLSIEGCNSTTVADFVSLIASDAASLATYFGASSLASQITSLAGTIATDIANWQSGGAAADAIQAINDLIGLVNDIPIAAAYAPLIVLILSALSGLLALLPNSVAAMTSKTHAVFAARNVSPAHYGGFDKKSMTEAKKSFVKSWNAAKAGLIIY